MLNRILFLESRQRFLEEKIQSYEKDTGPIYYTLPVKVYDVYPVINKENRYYLVIINKPTSQEGNIIEVSRDVMEKLVKYKTVTIDDYVMTDKIARRKLINKKWEWQIIN